MEYARGTFPALPGEGRLPDADLPPAPGKPDRLYFTPAENRAYGYWFIDFYRHAFSIVNTCSPVKQILSPAAAAFGILLQEYYVLLRLETGRVCV